MNWKAVSKIMLLLLSLNTLTMGFFVLPIKASSASETRVYVDPPSIVDQALTPGNGFTVEVMVSDVDAETGCYRWQVHMSWDPGVLKFGSVTEGNFLKDQPEGTIDFSRIEESWALLSWTTVGRYQGAKDSGTLATVEFLVVGIGESVIDIDNPMTRLLSVAEYPPHLPPPMPPPNSPLPMSQAFNTFREITFMKENGYFRNFDALVVSSTININPDTMNLKSKGRWITAYIELPENYNVSDIDISTVKLNHVVSAEQFPTKIGDSDDNSIPDLMVKFDRQEAIALLSVNEAILTISGEVDGISFEGSDTITVIDR